MMISPSPELVTAGDAAQRRGVCLACAGLCLSPGDAMHPGEDQGKASKRALAVRTARDPST